MRITNSMLIKDMLWNANSNLVSMAKKQSELSTGKKIQRPSDDPVGITQVLKYKTDIREAEQYSKNITDAKGWLDVSESSLNNLKDILQRVRELTVQASNGTNTAADTSKMKTEIEQLTKEIVVIGNSTSAGRYIFTGLETNKKLFNLDGTYNIDLTTERVAQKRTIGYEVAVGEVIGVGTYPTDIFGIVPSTNAFAGFITGNSASTIPASQGIIKADVNVDNDFTGDALSFNISGSIYTVDTSVLENTPMNPMTKDRFLASLSSANDGGTGLLSDVADVYFDSNNQLVVATKEYGVTAVMNPPATTSIAGKFTLTSSTNGTDATSATLTGLTLLPTPDAAVASQTGIHTIVLQVDGVRNTFDIDFDAVTDFAGLKLELQTQLNLAYPLPLAVTVDAGNNSRLDFSITGNLDDNMSHTLSVDYIANKDSEMISDMKSLLNALEIKDDPTLQTVLGKLDVHLDRVVSVLGEIGGKGNRLEFILSRVEENKITFTSLLSTVQDVDMAEAIMYFKNLENVYRASLSVGSKVIQPSLVDFIN